MDDDSKYLDEIKQIVNDNPKNYIRVLKSLGFMDRYKNRQYLIDFILKKTSILNNDLFDYSLKTRVYWLLNGIKDWNDPKVQCCICHKPFKNLNVLNINAGYKNTCSKQCRYIYGQQMIKQTCNSKYGVENPFQMKTVKDNIASKKDEILEKKNITHRKNNSFKTSNAENKGYVFLVDVFGDVKRNYKSDKYPFRCDYYIPKFDLYIELNASWTHGYMKYVEDDDLCKKQLAVWSEKAKTSAYYKNAIVTWTIRDPMKRQIASINKVNFKEFWNLNELKTYIMQFMKYVEDKYGKDYLKQFKNSNCEEDISIPFVDSRLQKEFAYYKKLDQKSFPKAQANSHNYIVKYFQQKEFYKEEIKLWRDHDIRMRLTENRCHYLNKTIDELNAEEILRGFKIAGIHIGYSHFNPVVMNWFVKEYGCRCLYDPCGGWGHRLLGSLKLDKYIYNDFSLHTKLNVDRMVEYFGLKHVETHNNDARLFVPNDDFDAMFTCPPYFNIEKYECDGFKDESEFKAFIDRLFEVFESKKSCKTFGLVIRDDMLYGHDNWTKKLVIGRDADQTHLRKARTFQEALFIFQK